MILAKNHLSPSFWSRSLYEGTIDEFIKFRGYQIYKILILFQRRYSYINLRIFIENIEFDFSILFFQKLLFLFFELTDNTS